MSEQKIAIRGGFFNSINEDRLYSAEEMNRPYKRIVSEGIFATPTGTASTDLQVLSADDGMNIIVKAGEGILGKKWFENPADLVITVPNNNSIVPCIDSIIVQTDNTQNGRIVNIICREGIASSNPVEPEINQFENIIEMRVANIYVEPNAKEIGQEKITDLRGSSECKWITSLITQVDTSTLFLQYQAAYAKYYNESTEAFEQWLNGIKEQTAADLQENQDTWEELIQTQTQEFQEWFLGITEQLDGDVATNLLNKITALETGKADAADLTTLETKVNTNTTALTNKADKKKTWDITIDTTWTRNRTIYKNNSSRWNACYRRP